MKPTVDSRKTLYCHKTAHLSTQRKEPYRAVLPYACLTKPLRLPSNLKHETTVLIQLSVAIAAAKRTERKLHSLSFSFDVTMAHVLDLSEPHEV